MKRGAAVLGAGAVALCIAAGPASSTSVTGDVATGRTTAAVAPGDVSETLGQSDTQSDSRLAATAAVFLVLGIGTLGAAHRRRWREVTVHDGTADPDDEVIDQREPAVDSVAKPLDADTGTETIETDDLVIDLRDGADKQSHTRHRPQTPY